MFVALFSISGLLLLGMYLFIQACFDMGRKAGITGIVFIVLSILFILGIAGILP